MLTFSAIQYVISRMLELIVPMFVVHMYTCSSPHLLWSYGQGRMYTCPCPHVLRSCPQDLRPCEHVLVHIVDAVLSTCFVHLYTQTNDMPSLRCFGFSKFSNY